MLFYPKRIKFTYPSTRVAEHDIFVPQTLDSLNIPIKNGLQDEFLGPQPHELRCNNCCLSYYNCPGHFGRIKLNAKILNPLIFKDLFNILKICCFKCNKFKICEYDRNICRDHVGNKLITFMKSNVKIECPFCAFHTQIRRLNLKIIVNGKYQLPCHVFSWIKEICKNEPEMFERMGIASSEKFFMDEMLVLPNKFRPLNKANDKIFESFHNIHLSRIIKINNLLENTISKASQQKADQNPCRQKVAPTIKYTLKKESLRALQKLKMFMRKNLIHLTA